MLLKIYIFFIHAIYTIFADDFVLLLIFKLTIENTKWKDPIVMR